MTVLPFNERATSMGLEEWRDGVYRYQDQYSEVVYRSICTTGEEFEPEGAHDTDRVIIPYFALFTRAADQLNWNYCGLVSLLYKFIGNDVLNQKVRDSITETGTPILEENTIYPPYFTRMRNEIFINSSVQTPEVGDIVPIMIVNNTYNGTGAAMTSFGIAIKEEGRYLSFAFDLGKLRQVHIESSGTSMTSAIEDYLQVFNESITEMITRSFNTQVTEDAMLSTLDMVEELGGKNRRQKISKILDEITPDVTDDLPPLLPSSWQVFLAIVRYSSLEPNLNIKRLLENAAERVLVIPTRMYEVLAKLQS